MNRDIDDLKADFVLSVYDQITKQIQQTDLKTSIIISWDSVIAIMLGRELGQMVSGRFVNPFTIAVASLCAVFLAVSGVFIFWTLKPRTKVTKRPGFTGLLYTGDILRLGHKASERVPAYLEALSAIREPPGIYEQFANSIVLISDIMRRKNRSFMRALGATAISFGFLVVLIGVVAIRLGLLDKS
jgi:hypothetical protein